MPFSASPVVTNTLQPGASAGGTSSNFDTTGCNLLVLVTNYLNGQTLSVADSLSNFWNGLTLSSRGNNRTQIWYVENPLVGSGYNYTISGTATFPVARFSGWNGAATSSVFDQENTNSSGDPVTSLNTGSVTPTVDNELAIAVMGYDVGPGGAISIDDGFTLDVQIDIIANALGLVTGYLVQTSAAAADPSFSWPSSMGGIPAAIATFKSAAAAAGAPFVSVLAPHITQVRRRPVSY